MPTAEAKLDQLITLVTEIRIDQRAGTVRTDAHDLRIADIETRLRAAEQHIASTPPDTEPRLKAVERFQWKQIGVAAGSSGVLAGFLSWVAHR